MNLGVGINVRGNHPPVQANVDLNVGLVAFWKMEEAGSRADATGRGNTLLRSDVTGRAAGKIGFAANFVAADNSYLFCASNSDLQMSAAGEHIIAAWVKPTADSLSGNIDLICKGTPLSPEYSLGLEDGAAVLSIKKGCYSGVLAADEWHLLVALWDKTNGVLRLSLDGAAPGGMYDGGGLVPGDGDFFVGTNTAADTFFDGLTDATGKWYFATPLTTRRREDFLAALWNDGAGWEPV